MSQTVDETHDPALRSWVSAANAHDCDFPLQNLPFAIFRRDGSDEPFHAGVAIGDDILDLRCMSRRRIFDDLPRAIIEACAEASLNRLMSMGRAASVQLRAALCGALREGSSGAAQLAEDLVPQTQAQFDMPAIVGDYTDFYSSIHHATAVGRQFRPDNPLLPNYRWVPIAYHGRSSSIGVSERDFARPVGQVMPPGAPAPLLRPTQKLDFELEVGVFIGAGNALGAAIAVADAEEHAFGLCLLNDWSARDIQGWEYQPLGPFSSKNFATTISPWVVTFEALAPFRRSFERAADDPQPLPYLSAPRDRSVDMALRVELQTREMRARGAAPHVLATSNFRYSYWTVAQMIAHHTVTGCNLRPGDLLGSGTLSGPALHEAGSLLELTEGGKRPLLLPHGEQRMFLEDGDRVVMRAWCEREGRRRIGFGTAVATVLPSHFDR